jgi:hypothetical protein
MTAVSAFSPIRLRVGLPNFALPSLFRRAPNRVNSDESRQELDIFSALLEHPQAVPILQLQTL